MSALDDLLTHGDVSRLDPPLGHELEIAELLRFIKRERVRNTVWITADMHYCAAHYYDPQRAAFSDFDGFWEFVAGPLNAGSFGPNTIDGSFGPQVMFAKAPPPGQVNLSPYAGLQLFGEVSSVRLKVEQIQLVSGEWQFGLGSIGLQGA